jgi:hypothetical protein
VVRCYLSAVSKQVTKVTIPTERFAIASLDEGKAVIPVLSTGISFDIACETHKTLKEQEPELFISGKGKRFMLLLSQDDSLSLVEFDRKIAVSGDKP